MKNSVPATLALALVLGACSKSDVVPNLPFDSGCSEVSVMPVTKHDISAAEVQTANGLFARNNIDNRTFRYRFYSRDAAVQTYYPPYATFESQRVGVEQYTNGLRILTGHLNYVFNNGVFTFRAGNLTNGTRLDTKPALEPGQLRGLFLATAEKYDYNYSSYNLPEQCVTLEFGYYDMNAGTGGATERLVKAWKVTRKNSEYPYAYYQDEDGALIYYDNGIRTFRQ
jgi:hypothetical protein